MMKSNTTTESNVLLLAGHPLIQVGIEDQRSAKMW